MCKCDQLLDSNVLCERLNVIRGDYDISLCACILLNKLLLHTRMPYEYQADLVLSGIAPLESSGAHRRLNSSSG